MRTTSGSVRERGPLLDAADVHVVRLPDQVGATLTVSDHRAHEPLEVVAGLFERPRFHPDIDLLEAGDRLLDLLDDLRVLLTEPSDVALEPWGTLQDLVVEAVRLLGHDHVLPEGVADLDHLLEHAGGPLRDPARGG